ncbi:MAG: threonine ammonia-lyase [Bacteroidaceae bacterium]|nr:threonine ammonia-lyase [Bacteroidaceae bacterium]MBR6483082.1 threonine ammonia-lyase [Bacteroidaceae bacterium]
MLTLDLIYKAYTELGNVVRRPSLIPTSKVNPLCNVFLKPENLQVTGSFKVRGASFKISQLTDEEKKRGVIACSAGNHAQGVALAAQRYGLPALICMPAGAPISKVEATRAMGAEICLVEGVYDDAYRRALQLNEEKGMTFIHPFDDELVIAGQGSVGMEIINENPDIDTVFVPIGGGGLASGVAYAVKTLKPSVRVIGVQAEGAASMLSSLSHNKIEALQNILTIADGIAVKEPGQHTFELCQHYVDEIVTVTEDEICAAILTLIEHHKLIAEGAGAVSVAAAMFNKVDVTGQNVCCIVSGGNIDVTILSRIINRGLMKSGRTIEMLIEMPDRPGSLLGLTTVIVRYGANIISIHHERNGESPDVNSCNLRIVLETRNAAHIRDIHVGIEAAGYTILQEK